VRPCYLTVEGPGLFNVVVMLPGPQQRHRHPRRQQVRGFTVEKLDCGSGFTVEKLDCGSVWIVCCCGDVASARAFAGMATSATQAGSIALL
jgi:hypothetical protein